MIRRPPSSPLFPSTPLSRSGGSPATTTSPLATKRPAAPSLAAAPSRRVVTSWSAASAARARRTASRPRGSANCEHPIDGAAGAGGDLGCDRHLVLQVAQRVPQVLERDHLHVAALGGLGRGDKLLLGVLTAQ